MGIFSRPAFAPKTHHPIGKSLRCALTRGGRDRRIAGDNSRNDRRHHCNGPGTSFAGCLGYGKHCIGYGECGVYDLLPACKFLALLLGFVQSLRLYFQYFRISFFCELCCSLYSFLPDGYFRVQRFYLCIVYSLKGLHCRIDE